MEPITPQQAQRIVAMYLAVLETHAIAGEYPQTLGDLPHPRGTIRAAFKIATFAMVATGQMTGELRDYLELGYVSLADYVDDEVAELLREYARAGQALASGPGTARDKVTTDAWRRIAEQSPLVGRLARAISLDADELRAEFQSWQAGAAGEGAAG